MSVFTCRYKGKTYRATVRIVRTSDQVSDFCRKVCAKLECCPNLFSSLLVTDVCPENCSVHTKTKYSEYNGMYMESHSTVNSNVKRAVYFWITVQNQFIISSCVTGALTQQTITTTENYFFFIDFG